MAQHSYSVAASFNTQTKFGTNFSVFRPQLSYLSKLRLLKCRK
jgi:hypothetical protein